jgi:hypothetical protein
MAISSLQTHILFFNNEQIQCNIFLELAQTYNHKVAINTLFTINVLLVGILKEIQYANFIFILSNKNLSLSSIRLKIDAKWKT